MSGATRAFRTGAPEAGLDASRRTARAVAAALLLLPAALSAAAPSSGDVAPVAEIFRLRIASIVHPISRDLLVDTLERADREGAAAVVVELDTPGGLLTSTREMTTAMLGAKTPIVVWVAPDGAQAASAGFFLLQAADFAAMAPATNTGAAHPVGGQGEAIEGPMGEKVEQDAAANVRALAARRGRNVERAEAAVVRSLSFTAEEALRERLIDVVAADWASLLAALDGRELEKPPGTKRTLRLVGAPVREFGMNSVQRFLSTLLHPNVAYLLLMLGVMGIYAELTHPGAIFPGVVGGISILLALYALSVLPVRFAGVALIVLGMLLLIAEIKVTSYGLLTVGGVGSLVLGALVLFRSAEPALRVSLGLVVPIALAVGAVAAVLVSLAARAQRARVRGGAEALLGAHAVARTALVPRGTVFLEGEWWSAVAETPVPAGGEVEVIGRDGMLLRVRAVGAPASAEE